MKKSLYIFGSLIVLFVAMDLTNHVGALGSIAFDVMAHRVGEPLPESISWVAYVAVHMIFLALGLALTSIGSLKQSDVHSMTSGGRILHALAGAAVFVSASICFLQILTVREAFAQLATSEEPPGVDQLRAMTDSVREAMRSGFMILGAAGGMFSLAAIAGLRRWPPRADEELRQPTRSRIQLVAVFASLALAITMFLVIPHVAMLREILTDTEQAPQPQQLVEAITGVSSTSLAGFGLMALLGLVHVAAAAFAAQPGDADVDAEDSYDENLESDVEDGDEVVDA